MASDTKLLPWHGLAADASLVEAALFWAEWVRGSQGTVVATDRLRQQARAALGCPAVFGPNAIRAARMVSGATSDELYRALCKAYGQTVEPNKEADYAEEADAGV